MKKALYGLKQALKAWYQKLSTCFLGMGFQNSNVDYSLFSKRFKESFLVVLVYMDDIIIIGSMLLAIDALFCNFHLKFALKD